jgi:ribonuclease J
VSDNLVFLPLGGTGEIGMNLNLYGYGGRWLMVDCGVTFEKQGNPSKFTPLNSNGRSSVHSEPSAIA